MSRSEKALTDGFSDNYLFGIPPYQRPYAWTIEKSVELLDDLVTSLGRSDWAIALLFGYCVDQELREAGGWRRWWPTATYDPDIL